MLSPTTANAEQFQQWATAERYSFEEMAAMADVQAFHTRRSSIRATEIRENLRRQFRGDSGFSAADLAHLLSESHERDAWVAALDAELQRCAENTNDADPEQAFAFARVAHTCASALAGTTNNTNSTNGSNAEKIRAIHSWSTLGPGASEDGRRLSIFGGRLWRVRAELALPKNGLRPDEIVWGRAPARLDLGGGWTDTPPYALEHGGCVLNAAVELNGQPPIQAFARVTRDPLIRIRSIDVGTQLELRDWDQLMDCAVAAGEFSLVQAALAISGFAPQNGKTSERCIEGVWRRVGDHDAGGDPERQRLGHVEHHGLGAAWP